MQHSLILTFKTGLLIGFVVSLSSCKLFAWDPDYESCHQVRIANSTNDTLIFSVITKHLCPSCEVAAEDAWKLLPDDNIHIAAQPKMSGFDLLNDYCGSSLDTAMVYKIIDDTLNSKKLYVLNLYNAYYHVLPVVKWGGTLQDLPDSIHSFYNKNSWVFSKNPNNSKAEVITFTITEDDLKP
jgi:hypothetical protein